jgi:predicted  nucleic acid-binding Zn-ribbon protein
VIWNQFFVLQEIDAQIDSLREELHLGSLLADDRSAHLDSESARSRRDAEALELRLRQREGQRAEAVANISASFLEYYALLRARLKVGPWVVGFCGASCPACAVPLPPDLLSDAESNRKLVSCPSCARVLIWRVAAP